MRRKEDHNVKTITMQSKIVKHDLDVKLSKVSSLLSKGNKVVVVITSKQTDNADQISQAKQISKSVKDHFSKNPSIEIEIESTDQGANVTLDLPMEGLQKTDIEQFVSNREVIKLAGLAPEDRKVRKQKEFEPIYHKYDVTEIVGFRRIDNIGEEEVKDPLDELERKDEARAELIAFYKKQEHEKKQKRRAGTEPTISKNQARFS